MLVRVYLRCVTGSKTGAVAIQCKRDIINVAVKTGLYGHGTAGQSGAEMFGKLEDTWRNLREALISRGGAVGAEVRSNVSRFAAVQLYGPGNESGVTHPGQATGSAFFFAGAAVMALARLRAARKRCWAPCLVSP